jgi:hypothetical protein
MKQAIWDDYHYKSKTLYKFKIKSKIFFVVVTPEEGISYGA